MNKKKLKKLARLIHEEVRQENRNVRLVKESEADYEWSDYNAEVSEKFKKFILNLVNYKNNLNISISEERISISVSDVQNIKKIKYNSNNYNTPIAEEDYIEILVQKDKGFHINKGYNLRTNYLDKNMYSDVVDEIKDKLKQINADNFNEIWSGIMKDSGLMRDNNLDEIFNG